MRRKNILIIIITFTCIIFNGCKTTEMISLYTNTIPTPIVHNSVLRSESLVRIYFPELYDDEGKVYMGDGVVIILSDGKTVVIDGFETEAKFKYEQFIRNLGITKIDYLIGSHWHIDHIGTFPYIIEKFPVGLFLSCGARTNRLITKQLDSNLKKYNIPEIILKEGDKFFFNDETFIDIFWPNLTEKDLSKIGKVSHIYNFLINNSSLVFKFNYKEFKILFTGDIYNSCNDILVKKYGTQLNANILKVPHHGDTKKTNKKSFIKAVSPEFAMVQDNRYIKDELLKRYTKLSVKLLYLFNPGYYQIETDGVNYTIEKKDL